MSIPKEPKEVSLPINSVPKNHAKNYREDANYGTEKMVNQLIEQGQTTPVDLHREPDGTLEILKGNRRLEGLYELLERKDANGELYNDPRTGKPFATVRAHVYEGLSAEQKLMLRLDHGANQSLNRVEMLNAAIDAFNTGLPDKRVVTMLRGLLEIYFPPKKTLADTEQARLENWKGAIQPMKLVWKGPTILLEAYKDKLRGKQKWPGKNELRELSEAFDKELSADKTNTVSRENPGPEFMTKFDAMKKHHAENDKPGAKGNQFAMMNRGQIDDLKKVCDSPIIKLMIDYITQAKPREGIAAFDKYTLELFNGQTDEQRKVFNVLNGTTEASGTEQATDETSNEVEAEVEQIEQA